MTKWFDLNQSVCVTVKSNFYGSRVVPIVIQTINNCRGHICENTSYIRSWFIHHPSCWRKYGVQRVNMPRKRITPLNLVHCWGVNAATVGPLTCREIKSRRDGKRAVAERPPHPADPRNTPDCVVHHLKAVPSLELPTRRRSTVDLRWDQRKYKIWTVCTWYLLWSHRT